VAFLVNPAAKHIVANDNYYGDNSVALAA